LTNKRLVDEKTVEKIKPWVPLNPTGEKRVGGDSASATGWCWPHPGEVKTTCWEAGGNPIKLRKKDSHVVVLFDTGKAGVGWTELA